MSSSESKLSTYIGIASYTVNGSPTQLAVVLSTSMHFDKDVLCGTAIQSVNGRTVSWKSSGRSPVLDPYMTLEGVMAVTKVDEAPGFVYQSISSLVWKAEHAVASRDGFKDVHSNDYACRVLVHLCNNRIIRLSLQVKKNLDVLITDGISKIRQQRAPTFKYPIISLAGDEDTGFA
jgi:hypothetical protein